jgi:hypothetical protein
MRVTRAKSMPWSPHPNAEPEEPYFNAIPLMPTFPASKVFQCQFCPKCFLTDGARKTHNVFEYRDYALAYIRMDEVGGATGEAGGARDEVGERWMSRKKHPLRRKLAPHPWWARRDRTVFPPSVAAACALPDEYTAPTKKTWFEILSQLKLLLEPTINRELVNKLHFKISILFFNTLWLINTEIRWPLRRRICT